MSNQPKTKRTIGTSQVLKPKKITKSIPANILHYFSDEEKSLYAKNIKELSKDEILKYYDIKIKITRLQYNIKVKKMIQKITPTKKQLYTAKIIFADVLFKIYPEETNYILTEIAKKPVTKYQAKYLGYLAKSRNLDLNFTINQ